jgi:hypothetical protein
MVALITIVIHQHIQAADLASQVHGLAEALPVDSGDEQPDIMSRRPEQDSVLSSIIKQKQRFYADTFPELTFIVLEGGESWPQDFASLAEMLGHAPVSLDYEHPPHLREDLMYVSLERIRIMLDSNTPSASLMHADTPMKHSKKLCIITISPTAIAADDRIATHYLIEPYHEIQGEITKENLVDRKHFLEFVFDHEVYHCLESHFIGPQPMSHLEFWADYYDYRHEIGADTFAIAMHIKRHQAVTGFVNKMIRIRGLSLFCDDCNHWTPHAIAHIARTDPVKLVSMDTMELLRYASSLRDDIASDYDDYLLYRSAAKEACNLLNSKLWSADESGTLPPPDPEMVNDMLGVFRNAYYELTGTEFSPDRAR